MSLYNALHGTNPIAGLLMAFIGIDPAHVPRFRDCFITEDGNVAIHTRTGGGNRAFYDSEESCRKNYPEYFEVGDDQPDGPWNEDLREVEGFIRDEDDDFDSTYATFYFKPNDDVAPLVKGFQEIMGTETPGDKWRKLFADMEAGKESPNVKHALEVGKPLIDAISKALEGEK